TRRANIRNLVISYPVTENERTAWSRGKRLSRLKAVEVYKIHQNFDPAFGDTVLEEQPVAASMVHRDVTQDSRESGRSLLPGQPSVAKVDRRHTRKPQQRRHSLQMVLPMDNVGRDGNSIEVVDHRNSSGSQLGGHLSHYRAVGNRRVPSFE